MNADEKYVKARWDDVKLRPSSGSLYAVWAIGAGIIGQGFSKDGAWHAACLYTVERLREIAEVEEEIALVVNVETTTAAFIASIYVAKHIKQDAAKEHPVWQRILAVEQSRLAELKRGMKEKP